MTNEQTREGRVLASALYYAEHYNWKIVPGFLDEWGKKRPWLAGWSENASTDPEEIRSWWMARPDSLVGLCCGMSNVVVIDIDIHDEFKNGFISLHQLLSSMGRDEAWFDSLTVTSRSGGGGKHYIFRAPDGLDFSKRKIEWKPGIDILMGGSFVVLPPSPHPSGTDYAWEASPADREVAELPPELIQELVKTTNVINAEERANSSRYQDILDNGSSSGSRNNDLIRLIGWLRRKHGDTAQAHQEIRAILEAWRDRCDPPYRGGADDDEFERTWQSGLSLPHVGFVDWFQDALANAGFEGDTTRDLSLWMEPRLGALVRRDTAGELYFWTGRRWEADDPKHITAYGMLDSRWGIIDAFDRDTEAAAVALENAGATRPATKLRAWSAQMQERAPMIDAMRMVTGRQDPVRDSEWDAHPNLLHCANGVVDLATGAVLEHNPALLNRTLCPTAYNPGAKKPPAWMKLFDFMLPGDWDTQRYLCAALGFSLWGDNHQKALFVLHGEANNGKSTLLQSFLQVIGVAQERKTISYGGMIEKKVMAESRSEQHPAGLADALLKRIGIMSGEWGMADKLNLELAKAITGDDMLSARFMREDFATFRPKVTPWIATNHALQLREFDASVRARLKLIELPGVIPEDKRKPSHEVRKELMEEAEGILNLVIQEMLRARNMGGLAAVEPQSLRDAVKEAVDSQDMLLQWFEMRCVAVPIEDVKEKGTAMSALRLDFEMRMSTHISAQSFSMRLLKLLGLKSGQIPRVMANGIQDRWYPVRLHDVGGGL